MGEGEDRPLTGGLRYVFRIANQMMCHTPAAGQRTVFSSYSESEHAQLEAPPPQARTVSVLQGEKSENIFNLLLSLEKLFVPFQLPDSI
jgi:hypothetical protein